uniref:Estrogen receptor n=1 Tax=Lygus hesperus TaxID=30085 RepID=A0A0A9XE19_LYGHE
MKLSQRTLILQESPMERNSQTLYQADTAKYDSERRASLERAREEEEEEIDLNFKKTCQTDDLRRELEVMMVKGVVKSRTGHENRRQAQERRSTEPPGQQRQFMKTERDQTSGFSYISLK